MTWYFGVILFLKKGKKGELVPNYDQEKIDSCWFRKQINERLLCLKSYSCSPQCLILTATNFLLRLFRHRFWLPHGWVFFSNPCHLVSSFIRSCRAVIMRFYFTILALPFFAVTAGALFRHLFWLFNRVSFSNPSFGLKLHSCRAVFFAILLHNSCFAFFSLSRLVLFLIPILPSHRVFFKSMSFGPSDPYWHLLHVAWSGASQPLCGFFSNWHIFFLALFVYLRQPK